MKKILILPFLLTSVFLHSQLAEAPRTFPGTWLPVGRDAGRPVIAGITRIIIEPLEGTFQVTVFWLSQGWPTRFRGTAVEAEGKLKVLLETSNHGSGSVDLWELDEQGLLTAYGLKFHRMEPQ